MIRCCVSKRVLLDRGLQALQVFAKALHNPSGAGYPSRHAGVAPSAWLIGFPNPFGIVAEAILNPSN